MDLGQSQLLGRSDEGLDNFDDKIEAALEEELTREVFERADDLIEHRVRKYSSLGNFRCKNFFDLILGKNKLLSSIKAELNY